MAIKGIAVSQIILLVLGILVLAVVAYLLITQFTGANTAISAETCRAEATRACTGCTIAGTLDSCTFSSASMQACIDGGYIQTGADPSHIACSVITGSGLGVVTGSVDCDGVPQPAANLCSGGQTWTCTDVTPTGSIVTVKEWQCS